MTGREHDVVSRNREFLDATGVLWQVVEVDGRHVPGSRGERCLLFSSSVAIRRVWDYPRAWTDAPPEELDALSWCR
jgi:hypothetical protein